MSTTWMDNTQVDVADLAAIVERGDELGTVQRAIDVVDGVPVYDAATLAGGDRDLLGELAAVFADGPGIVAIKNLVDRDTLDAGTAAFDALIAAQHAAGQQFGDHFAEAGTNDRVWNALEKLAVAEPGLFVDYYERPALHAVCEAWLGPGFTLSSQINVVRPGGKAQQPHRDYHLGFMTDEQAARFPRHIHLLSPALTLQGAVAHVDMPLASGPTTYLPFSQRWDIGYLGWRNEEVKAYYAEHHVQLALEAGDGVFFNPAVFHAAGTNVTTDVQRMANLLQVSSAFGQVMEQIDGPRMAASVLPALQERVASGWDEVRVRRAAIATCGGYAFPADLDLEQPVGGLAPDTDADHLTRAAFDRTSVEELSARLAARRG